MPEMKVMREGDTIKIVAKESIREQMLNARNTWVLEEQEQIPGWWNIWTLSLPVDDAKVLTRGLIEAGAIEKVGRGE